MMFLNKFLSRSNEDSHFQESREEILFWPALNVFSIDVADSETLQIKSKKQDKGNDERVSEWVREREREKESKAYTMNV